PWLWTKQGISEVKTPEELPTLRGKYEKGLDWQGKVVTSCMHCHMIEEAQRRAFRAEGKAIPEELLFPYPNPKSIGLVLDPKEKAHVQRVVEGSLVEKQGFRAGDDIVSMVDPILSIADVQWMLNRISDDCR